MDMMVGRLIYGPMDNLTGMWVYRSMDRMVGGFDVWVNRQFGW